MTTSGKPTVTTRTEFLAFARALRADGATLVEVRPSGAMKVEYPPVALPVHVHEDEPTTRFLPDLDESERGELVELRTLRDRYEELS